MNQVFTRLIVLSLFFVGLFSNESKAQAGDCPYPVIYIHGWNGTFESWEPTYNDGSFKNIWGGGVLPDNNIFWAMPNASDTHGYYQDCCVLDPFCWTSCRDWYLDDNQRNDDINGTNSTWDGTGSGADDVQWIFADENNVLNAGCTYAMNFNTGKNGDNTVRKNPGNFSSHTAPCDDCSENNEAAILKQGYALKAGIEAVLAANPNKGKVILVGHSMGGLCIREYLQRTSGGSPRWWVDPSSPDGHKVARVMTAGTPHRGSNSFESVLGRMNPDTGETYESSENQRNTLPDLNSEAVRDLRYKYTAWFGTDIAGLYLYGGNEEDMSDGTYWSEDVDCDGDDNSPNVIGINEIGSGNTWDGTRDNPSMPLPDNVRYTWFVTNQVGGALSTCKYKNYGCAGDGVVDDQRQWIYEGGQGRTEDFVDGVSVSVPNDGVPNRLSDRITSENRTFHTSQPGDIEYHVHGIDEGDYPKFAWDINFEHKYAGIVQLPPDVRPADGNRAANQDKDWYKVTIPRDVRGITVTVKAGNKAGRVDLYEAPADYEIGTSSINETLSANATTVLKSFNCYSANDEVYIRVQHDGVVRADWKTPFTIEVNEMDVEIPTVMGNYTATHEYTDAAGWTHYYQDGNPVLLLLSLQKGTSGVNVPTSSVHHNVTGDINTAVDLTGVTPYKGGAVWHVMDRFWDVDLTTAQQPTSGAVGVRFYYRNEDFQAVKTATNAAGGTVAAHTDIEFFKFDSGAIVNLDANSGHIGSTAANYIPYIAPSYSILNPCILASKPDTNNDYYAEFSVTSFSGGGGGATPVEFLSFEGERNERQVDLTWSTASELNADYFEVQRATTGGRFEAIGKVQATGNSTAQVDYKFVDTKPLIGANYYRLKQVDNDGAFEYSNIIQIDFTDRKAIEISVIRPVPVKDILVLDFENSTLGNVELQVFDALGRIVYQQNIVATKGENLIELDATSLTKGVYFLRINRTLDGQYDIRKFVKN